MNAHVSVTPPLLSIISVPIEATKSLFDPIAYVAQMRKSGVHVFARGDGKNARVIWDIMDAVACTVMCNMEDPALNINADPRGMRKVYEVLRAEGWIAAARENGLVIFPWLGMHGSHLVLQGGSEDDGPNDYSTASDRFMSHPDFALKDECQKSTVFNVLCAELRLDPDDPDLCAKVTAIMASRSGS